MVFLRKNGMYTPAATQYLKTVRDVWRYALTRFQEADICFGHGSDNAQDEAAYLVLKTLGLDITDINPFLEARLLPTELQQLCAMIDLRVEERIPVSYLTNQALQGDYEFYVDERVQIPRSFIAEVLKESIQEVIPYPELVHDALDLGTGCGSLAIQIADCFSEAEIDAVDLSIDALEVAASNIEDYDLEERIHLVHTDWFEGIDKTYDLIVATPPYLDDETINMLPEEYSFEPMMALNAGDNAIAHLHHIVQMAAKYLKPEGILLMDVGHLQDAMDEAFPELPFHWLHTSCGDGVVLAISREALLGQ